VSAQQDGRLRIGALIPSTNTVVEPELYAMLPPGVTAHAGRLLVTQPNTSSDALYMHLAEQMMDALGPTVSNLLTCNPDHLSLCMSAVAFYGGAKGDLAVRERLESMTDVPVSTGPAALLAAVRAYGVRRIVVLSPFQQEAHDEAVRYFEEHDLEVVGGYTFLAQSTVAIATVTPQAIRAAIAESDSERAELIMQVGTNLHMARLAAAAEWWLGKPVLHVNTVMAWEAMRTHGVDDRIDGFGSLLADH
jgi:maleate isomerase